LIIVEKTEQVIKEYLSDYENGRLEKPRRCEVCGRESELTWHAKYKRKLICYLGIYEIPIRRLLCPLCKSTFALIPEFIAKYRRYAKSIIVYAVAALKKKISFYAIADNLAKAMEAIDRYVDYSTLYRWQTRPP